MSQKNVKLQVPLLKSQMKTKINTLWHFINQWYAEWFLAFVDFFACGFAIPGLSLVGFRGFMFVSNTFALGLALMDFAFLFIWLCCTGHLYYYTQLHCTSGHYWRQPGLPVVNATSSIFEVSSCSSPERGKNRFQNLNCQRPTDRHYKGIECS